MSHPEILRRKTQTEQARQPLFENRFYQKKELCKILRLSLKTIDVLMADKKLEYKKIGRSVRFDGRYLNEKFGA